MKKTLLAFMAAIAISCSSDSSATDKAAITLVTGITLRQTTDDIPLVLGNPNTLVNNTFMIYPNPVNEIVNISAQGGITDVWLVPATAEKIYQDENYNSLLNNNSYTEQAITSHSVHQDSGLPSISNMALTIGDLPKGYYKIFVKIDGQIYWDNLYKYDSTDNETQMAAINAFWE